jgi:hypothetical protein
MTSRWIKPLLVCAAWLPASVALATGEPPKVQMKPATADAPASTAPTVPTVSAISVEATQPAELRKQTYNYVTSFAGTSPKIDGVSRWTHPVCVTVDGLPADKGAQVKGRVEEVAQAIGLKIAKAGCLPNIEIFFAGHAQAFLDQIAAQRTQLLGYEYRTEANKLKAMTRPIQAWYMTATVGTGNTGGTTSADQGGYQQNQAGLGIGEVMDTPSGQAPAGCGDSRFGGCLKSVFEHVLIVVDLPAAGDKSAGLLSDYVTMLALAQPKSLDACNGLVSVIDLFSSTCAGRKAPDGMTRADVAYLTSLYKANLEAHKSSQESDIASRMSDMLLKANKLDRLASDGGAPKTP